MMVGCAGGIWGSAGQGVGQAQPHHHVDKRIVLAGPQRINVTGSLIFSTNHSSMVLEERQIAV